MRGPRQCSSYESLALKAAVDSRIHSKCVHTVTVASLRSPGPTTGRAREAWLPLGVIYGKRALAAQRFPARCVRRSSPGLNPSGKNGASALRQKKIGQFRESGSGFA
jgi:hypothetical protein